MVSGGESTTDAFEDMCSAQDMANVRTLDAIIHSLPKEQQDALYCKYLKSRKPLAYEYKLEIAMDNLLTIASKRINDIIVGDGIITPTHLVISNLPYLNRAFFYGQCL
jgi:hypothetical protein